MALVLDSHASGDTCGPVTTLSAVAFGKPLCVRGMFVSPYPSGFRRSGVPDMTRNSQASLRLPPPYAGPSLLEMLLLNKGSARQIQERIDFNRCRPAAGHITIEEAPSAYSQYANL